MDDIFYAWISLGTLFHTAPNVPHYARNKAKGVLQVGHVFTIEPMINLGKHRDCLWPDGWTAVTEDGSRSAQFEHTMVSRVCLYDCLSPLSIAYRSYLRRYLS